MILNQTTKPFIAFFILIMLFIFLPINDFYMFSAFALLLILFGIPHGALDIFSIEKIARFNRSVGKTYLFNYLLLIFLYLLVFLLSFIFLDTSIHIGIFVFILIGAFHFRHDWNDDKTLTIILSLSSLLSPSIFNSVLLIQYLEYLYIPKNMAELLTQIFFILFFILNIVLIFHFKRLKIITIFKYLIVILCSFISDPIIFFICYFCCIHSFLHTHQYITENNLTIKSVYDKTKWILFFTVILFITCIFYFDEFEFSEQIIKASFIGLFSFTIPHILVHTIKK